MLAHLHYCFFDVLCLQCICVLKVPLHSETMSITYQKQQRLNNKQKGVITIDNGDLEALEGVMAQYAFVNQEALLRYALVTLLSAEDNKLYIKRDGTVLSVKVSDTLLKKQQEESNSKYVVYCS